MTMRIGVVERAVSTMTLRDRGLSLQRFYNEMQRNRALAPAS